MQEPRLSFSDTNPDYAQQKRLISRDFPTKLLNCLNQIQKSAFQKNQIEIKIRLQEMNTKVFSTRIRESVKCQEAQTLRMSIFDYAPSCTTAIDYKELTEEILNDLNIEGK